MYRIHTQCMYIEASKCIYIFFYDQCIFQFNLQKGLNGGGELVGKYRKNILGKNYVLATVTYEPLGDWS